MPPAPTTMELARLYGIREDDPKRYRVVRGSESALKELDKAVSAARNSPSVLAQFFSHYFPRLLKILHDIPPEGFIYAITLHLLYHISKAKLPQDDPSTANSKAHNPSRDLHLLLSLVRSSIDFNPAASKLNFHLKPSLLVDLAQLGNHFLSTPYLQNASDDDDDEKARDAQTSTRFGAFDVWVDGSGE